MSSTPIVHLGADTTDHELSNAREVVMTVSAAESTGELTGESMGESTGDSVRFGFSGVSVPGAALECLRRAALTLREAILADDPAQRYALAHVSALRATAAVLAARARPTGRAARQRNAWVLLRHVAPEFGEWADYFAAGAGKRAAAEAGVRSAVTVREADDLVRDADHFLAAVETSFGLTGRVA